MNSDRPRELRQDDFKIVSPQRRTINIHLFLVFAGLSKQLP